MRPIDPKLLERINGAIADIREGKMVILVDDEFVEVSDAAE